MEYTHPLNQVADFEDFLATHTDPIGEARDKYLNKNEFAGDESDGNSICTNCGNINSSHNDGECPEFHDVYLPEPLDTVASMLKAKLDLLSSLRGISEEDREKSKYANWIVDKKYGENITEDDAQVHVEILMMNSLDELKNMWFDLTDK